MSDQKIVPCRCGADAPEPETDVGFKNTFIECDSCGRLVDGLDKTEAIVMWNTVMTPRESYI